MSKTFFDTCVFWSCTAYTLYVRVQQYPRLLPIIHTKTQGFLCKFNLYTILKYDKNRAFFCTALIYLQRTLIFSTLAIIYHTFCFYNSIQSLFKYRKKKCIFHGASQSSWWVSSDFYSYIRTWPCVSFS